MKTVAVGLSVINGILHPLVYQKLSSIRQKGGGLLVKSTPPFTQKPACFLEKQAGFLNLPLVLFSKAGGLLGLRFRWAYFSFSHLSMASISFRSTPKQENIFAP